MKRATKVEVRATEWLIEGRIPKGRIVVVSGRPGEGKSLWSAWLAALVSQHAPVIFSNQEDDEAEDVVPRLKFAGAQLNRVFFPTELDFPVGYPVIPRDTEALERRIKQIGAALVVFDAATQHIGANVYDNQSVRKALTPLQRMLSRTGCTAIFVDHLKKSASRSGHVLEAFAGGGSGLIAAARFVYAFGTSPEEPDERILAPAKVNHGQTKTSMSYAMDVDDYVLTTKSQFRKSGKLIVPMARLTLTAGDCKVTAKQVVSYTGGDSGKGGNPTTLAVAAEWLIGTLMFGPVDLDKVKAEHVKAGFSWATIRRASDEVKVVKDSQKLPGFGTGSKSTWALPKGHPALKAGQRAIAARKAAMAARKKKAGGGDEAS